MADLKDEAVLKELDECKKDINLRLIRASLLCGCDTFKPLCTIEKVACPFKIKGRIYRGSVFTCSVSLMTSVLEEQLVERN